MTLDRPVRDVVTRALDVEVVPDSVVRSVEGDDQLWHLACAARQLSYADELGDCSASLAEVESLADQRVRELVDGVEIHHE